MPPKRPSGTNQGQQQEDDDRDPQYDGTGKYSNGETVIWYDTDGTQHVEVIAPGQ